MTGYEKIARAALAGVAALLIAMPPSVAQERKQATAQASKRNASETKTHRLILQVNSNEPATMNLALNNATNVAQYYKDLGEPVEIEIVTFGPGLHMLRDDTSPVKARIKAIAASTPAISFKACGNTQENMAKAENKEIALVPEASLVKSGVVRVMELQERGWTYVRP
ncbi:DsrE family protein [Bosea sp. TAF32]|uniref:DsrE family protein n=1 Tax=Bosea sp. TAF32 TaxID=3237482 RepID=UPI003F8E0C15